MTATRGFIYRNRLDDATLSGGAWDALSRLQSGHLWKPATADDATEASTRIDFDFGAAISLRALWIPASNLTATATVRWTFGSSSGASDLGDSTALSAFPYTPPFGHEPRFFGIPIIMPADVTARYCRLQISDTANPADPWISRPVLGSAFLVEYNPVSIERDWQNFSGVRRTTHGVDWSTSRSPLRKAGLVYHVMSEAEDSLLSEIVRTHDTTQDVVFLESTHDRSKMQQRGFMALMREMARTEYPYWRYPGVALAFDERGGAPA